MSQFTLVSAGKPAVPSPTIARQPLSCRLHSWLSIWHSANDFPKNKHTWAILMGKVQGGWAWPYPPLEIMKDTDLRQRPEPSYLYAYLRQWIWGTRAKAKVSSQNARAAHLQVCNHLCTRPPMYQLSKRFLRTLEYGGSEKPTILLGSIHNPWLQIPPHRESRRDESRRWEHLSTCSTSPGTGSHMHLACLAVMVCPGPFILYSYKRGSSIGYRIAEIITCTQSCDPRQTQQLFWLRTGHVVQRWILHPKVSQ